MLVFAVHHKSAISIHTSYSLESPFYFPTPCLSVQFSCSVVSDSLWPHGLQHSRLPCPGPIHRTYSNSCPLSQWCHPTISSSVVPFSPSPPAFNLSQHQGLFKWVISSHQVTKYWSFSVSINPPSKYSGLISFRIDWLDRLTVQGTLNSGS